MQKRYCIKECRPISWQYLSNTFFPDILSCLKVSQSHISYFTGIVWTTFSRKANTDYRRLFFTNKRFSLGDKIPTKIWAGWLKQELFWPNTGCIVLILAKTKRNWATWAMLWSSQFRGNLGMLSTKHLKELSSKPGFIAELINNSGKMRMLFIKQLEKIIF